MSSYLEKESLLAALEAVKCKDLPPELKDGEIFVRALVRVLKTNNQESYCYAINDGTNTPQIKKSFGTVAQIVRVLSIHPLSVLDKNYIPSFNVRDEVKAYLSRSGENDDYLNRLFDEGTEESKAAIKSLVIKHSIQDQLREELRADYMEMRAKREAEAAERAKREEAEREAKRQEKEKEIKERAKNEEAKRTKRQAAGRKARTKA